MDGSFGVLEASSIKSNPGDKLVIVRYPKQININEFNNLYIDWGKNQSKYKCGEQVCEFLIENESIADNLFRPLLRKRNNEGVSVGRKFDASLTISRNISLDFSERENVDLQVNAAYSKIEQLPYLQVRSLPTGSLSTVDEVNKRNGEKTMYLKSFSKTDEVEKKGRKSKKQKK